MTIESKVNDLMTIQEVAEYLGVKENTIYVWLSRKKIPAKTYRKIGRVVRFVRSELENWILHDLHQDSFKETYK